MSILGFRRVKGYVRNGLLCVCALGISIVSAGIGNDIVDNIEGKLFGKMSDSLTDNSDAYVQVDTDVEKIKEPTNLYSLSAVLMDAESGRVLFEKDGYTVRANASTTKILTCILAIESGKLDELVTVSKYAASMPDVQLNVREGEQYVLEDLLYSLMLESHNDVAVAIAEHISGSVEAFSDLMNKKALELGCENTYFITPNGLDATKEVGGEERIHGTTAAELARIMSYCIQNEKFLEITRAKTHTFSSKEVGADGTVSNGAKTYTVSNKNAFLTMMDGVLSGKTGFTNQAGYCYVCAVQNDGRTYAVALLGCGWPNNKTYKWSDTRKLATYGMEYYSETDFFDYNMDFAEIPVDKGVFGKYEDYGVNGIYADYTPTISVGVNEASLTLLHRQDEEVKREIWLLTRMAAPVTEGDVVGYVRYTMGDEIVGEYDIYARESVKKKDFAWAFKCVLNKFALH